jgi:hypothetical protein
MAPQPLSPSAAPTGSGQTVASSVLPPDQYYSIIRGQIEHEDNLISTRLNWFITSQSFLFTAYAITCGNIQQPSAGIDHQRLSSLLFLIPAIAIAISGVICFGIVAGVLAMRSLRWQYQEHALTCDVAHLPPVQGYRTTQVLGISVPLMLPVLFLLVWMFLLLK